MITMEFITALFYEVDEQLRAIPKHPEAHLWPSEVVTLGLLHALKGGGNRAFYRWLTRDYRPCSPACPSGRGSFVSSRPITTGRRRPSGRADRARRHRHLWHRVDPPHARGCSPQQIGLKGLSNHRWIVGGKLCLLLNQWGLIVGWACATANVADNTFQGLIQQVDGRMIVLSDTGSMPRRGIPAT